MTLRIESFVLGPLENNSFAICDEDTRLAAIIDPPLQGLTILDRVRELGWKLTHILITHAHFDHIATAIPISKQFTPPISIALHPDDLSLWRTGGGAKYFGFEIDTSIDPDFMLSNGQSISLGNSIIEVRHTPGHSPGHVLFYAPSISTAFCGDLIFRRGVGRTDLIGGDFPTLVRSIRTKVFTLPPDTHLLPGHGPETTPGEEIAENPFLD